MALFPNHNNLFVHCKNFIVRRIFSNKSFDGIVAKFVKLVGMADIPYCYMHIYNDFYIQFSDMANNSGFFKKRLEMFSSFLLLNADLEFLQEFF